MSGESTYLKTNCEIDRPIPLPLPGWMGVRRYCARLCEHRNQASLYPCTVVTTGTPVWFSITWELGRHSLKCLPTPVPGWKSAFQQEPQMICRHQKIAEVHISTLPSPHHTKFCHCSDSHNIPTLVISHRATIMCLLNNSSLIMNSSPSKLLQAP